MCLQVIVAAIYYNPQLLFETLDTVQMSMSSTESISVHFIRQWLQDTDCFFGLVSLLLEPKNYVTDILFLYLLVFMIVNLVSWVCLH